MDDGEKDLIRLESASGDGKKLPGDEEYFLVT